MRALECEFDFPAMEAPEWKERVERWYQLDAAAYGLCEAYWRWKESLTSPDAILLASPRASNDTDLKFASTGASSPARFVHTLPNIRSSPLCQVMGWSGPLLCIQNDPLTLETALEEACSLASGPWPKLWVLSVSREENKHRVKGFFW